MQDDFRVQDEQFWVYYMKFTPDLIFDKFHGISKIFEFIDGQEPRPRFHGASFARAIHDADEFRKLVSGPEFYFGDFFLHAWFVLYSANIYFQRSTDTATMMKLATPVTAPPTISAVSILSSPDSSWGARW